MQPFLLGKFHGMTPYTDDTSTMFAKIIGLRMPYDNTVKVFLLIIHAEVQAFVRTVTKQHDTLTWRRMAKQMPHLFVGAIGFNQPCSQPFIKD